MADETKCPRCGSGDVPSPLEDPAVRKQVASALWNELTKFGGGGVSGGALPHRCTWCGHEWIPDELSAPDSDNRGRAWSNECPFFFAGHKIHYIQALKAAGGHADPGRVLDIDFEGTTLTVETSHGVREYRHHETDQLWIALETFGYDVFVQARWSLLRVPKGGSFSIAPADMEWRPCPSSR